MLAINCQNTRLTDVGETACERFLAAVPRWIIEELKKRAGTPEGRLILRCPSCNQEGRFVEVFYDTDGKSHFQVVTGRLEIKEKMSFDITINMRQVA